MNKNVRSISKLVVASSLLPMLVGCTADEGFTPDDLTPTKPKPEEPKPEEPDEPEILGPKRNVLLIMADDFNFWNGTTNYYPGVITPNINALAERGVMFSTALSAAPVSNPSRNAMWSGVRPCTSGIWSNGSIANGGGYIRDVPGYENVVTMNQYFKENGYFVFGGGKLYHPGTMDPKASSAHDTDPTNWTKVLSNKTGSGATGTRILNWQNPGMDDMKIVVGTDPSTEANTNDLALVNDVAEFITNYEHSENADTPFFIGCGIFRPHIPWNFSKQYWDMYEGAALNPPAGYLENDLADVLGPNGNVSSSHTGVLQDGMWSNAIRAYLSCLTMTDHHMGIVVDALNKTKYKDNTIIVFVGDHGWHLGEKDRWSKYSVFGQANKTTLVIYDPASTNTTTHICDHPVSMQDLYPTLVKLCNIPRNRNVEGTDISELIENPKSTSWSNPVLCSYSGTHYVQDSEYKLISAGENSQLYHVKNDPHEFDNLYNVPGHETIVMRYQHKIDSMRAIGAEIKKRMGIASTPAMPKSVALPAGCPSSISDFCGERLVMQAKTLQYLSLESGKLTLDLLYNDPGTEISLFSRDGVLLEKQSVEGEKTTTVQTHIDLKDAYYLVVKDQDVVSVELLKNSTFL